MQLTRTHRILIGVVVAGAMVIAGIGFAGSYAAVRDLARDKGFGDFANVFPIGVDAGIVVLLALDLLLTWIRIPFPLLRQTAWLLTAATIAFNGAAAWPDPLGVGMHAVIPVLFVVSVEAARHAIGRIADITADRHMESVRIARWLLAPVPTFRLWRRMKLWELRSYDDVIKIEQDRLVYRARLRARYGRAWRRKAPVESLMPLRLARYGVPLSETADQGLAAAGIEPPVVRTALTAAATAAGGPGSSAGASPATPSATQGAAVPGAAPGTAHAPAGQAPQALPLSVPLPVYQHAGQDHDGRTPVAYAPAEGQHTAQYEAGPYGPRQHEPEPHEPGPYEPGPHEAGPPQHGQPQAGQYESGQHESGQLTVPVVPGRVRTLGGQRPGSPIAYASGPDEQAPDPGPDETDAQPLARPMPYAASVDSTDAADLTGAPGGDADRFAQPVAPPEDMPLEEVCYGAYRQYLADNNKFPSAFQFGRLLRGPYGLTELDDDEVRSQLSDCKTRYRTEMEAEHIP